MQQVNRDHGRARRRPLAKTEECASREAAGQMGHGSALETRVFRVGRPPPREKVSARETSLFRRSRSICRVPSARLFLSAAYLRGLVFARPLPFFLHCFPSFDQTFSPTLRCPVGKMPRSPGVVKSRLDGAIELGSGFSFRNWSTTRIRTGRPLVEERKTRRGKRAGMRRGV